MSVWSIAAADGRDYITPEDIAASIETDPREDQFDLWRDVLQAIAALLSNLSGPISSPCTPSYGRSFYR